MARTLMKARDYVEGILNRDRRILSQAITLIESTRADHQDVAREVVAACQAHTGQGLRIGITGPPGAGKSTFIDALGSFLTARKKKIAVLAVDPSSKRSKGSILGDKTRMHRLSAHPDAFIRPSPNAGVAGGLTNNTREALVLCEAAGFDLLLVETVGTGQSEFEVHSMVDMVLLILITGAGDELQGIKRGIMEMADAIIVNKADGENERDAELLSRSIKQTIRLMPAAREGWTTRVHTASSLQDTGIEGIWNTVEAFEKMRRADNQLEANRKEQAIAWMHAIIERTFLQDFSTHPDVRNALKKYTVEVETGAVSPDDAARMLLDIYYTALAGSR